MLISFDNISLYKSISYQSFFQLTNTPEHFRSMMANKQEFTTRNTAVIMPPLAYSIATLFITWMQMFFTYLCLLCSDTTGKSRFMMSSSVVNICPEMEIIWHIFSAQGSFWFWPEDCSNKKDLLQDKDSSKKRGEYWPSKVVEYYV